MTDIDAAIDVTTSVEINWGELGRFFAEQPSPAQAEFFIGFYEAVVDEQLAYIGAENIFTDVGRSHVGGVFASLAYFIDPTTEGVTP